VENLLIAIFELFSVFVGHSFCGGIAAILWGMPIMSPDAPHSPWDPTVDLLSPSATPTPCTQPLPLFQPLLLPDLPGIAAEKIVNGKGGLRNNLFSRMIRQEMAYHDSLGSGSLLTRFAADTEIVKEALTNYIPKCLEAISCVYSSSILPLPPSPSPS
jgi:hypothetical protein